jgi:phospholipase/carboxylesterase
VSDAGGLVRVERPAAGEPDGLLVLHHGRGTDEQDLLPLAGVLDPRRRLHVVAPRAPLQLGTGPGYHWYLVPRVGTPDPQTFRAAFAQLAELHDALWAATGLGPERTVLGGFSMGAVMSYALGLGPDRPVPAGILALSGFLPRVEGWQPDLAGRRGMPVLIAHGRRDAIIDVGFARTAQELLREGGLDVEYRESDAGHHVDPRELPAAAQWLQKVLAPPAAGARPPA